MDELMLGGWAVFIEIFVFVLRWVDHHQFALLNHTHTHLFTQNVFFTCSATCYAEIITLYPISFWMTSVKPRPIIVSLDEYCVLFDIKWWKFPILFLVEFEISERWCFWFLYCVYGVAGHMFTLLVLLIWFDKAWGLNYFRLSAFKGENICDIVCFIMFVYAIWSTLNCFIKQC